MRLEAVFFWPVFLGLFWAMFSVHAQRVRAQKWSQKSPTNMATEKSVYVLGLFWA
jgi:hypothetical protein